MTKVAVIGGGASGLIAAIYAAKENNQVILIERNSVCAKKILLTGNGKCNYLNLDQDIKHYHTTQPEYLKKIITEKNITEIRTFFDTIGIVPKVKNTLVYPFSNQATSIKEALILQANILNISIQPDTLIDKIEKKDSTFILNPNRENICVDKVILAVGSKACPKTGSDGNGYELAQSFSHSITPVLPALTSLMGIETYFKAWNGVRCDAILSLYENNIKIREEQGEIQFTDYGISGICTFNLSGMVSRGLFQHKKMNVTMNFLPWLQIDSIQDQITWLDQRNNQVQKRTIEQLLEGFLPYQLISVILKKNQIQLTKYWNQCSFKEKTAIAESLHSFYLDIVGTCSFDKAQTCTGGVPLNEIKPETMESLHVKGLYVVGELLDVDGDCGGYNLSFAWVTGMLAGKDSASND